MDVYCRAALAVLCALALVSGTNGCGRGSIYLMNNEYKQVLIAIGPQVPENPALIQKLKDVFTKASAFLYQATRKRAFLKEITILVPKTWQDKPEYQKVTTESYDKSDIVADVPDQRFNHGNKPFVIKTTPCGQLGHYMHLTPDYLLNDNIALAYGPYEKVIVHEWGHLRYGVFDEYPTAAESNYFYSASNGEIEGTRCTFGLKGKMYDSKTGSDYCTYSGTMPDSACRYKVDSSSESGYGSLMYKQFLNQITEFCDDDKSNPRTLHNREAPTKQNKQCDSKSIWEVMRTHGDFNNRNQPRNVTSTAPTFKVVREKSKRTVLVLDVSGSMKDNDRIGKLRQACSLFIRNIVRDGEAVGVVWFNAQATVKTRLTTINNTTRKTLLNSIPRTPEGGTSIGAGIRAGIAVLGNEPDGGSLLVVTDGAENKPPFIKDVREEVIRSNVIVDSIAISKMADTKLDDLAKSTGGKAFFYPDTSSRSNVLNEALLTIGERNTNVFEKKLSVKSIAEVILPAATKEDFTFIDSSIGKQTTFTFDMAYDQGAEVVLTSPSGSVIDKTSKEYTYDAAFRAIQISLNKAEAGKWQYNITNKRRQSQRIATTVTSQAAKVGEIPLMVNAYWGSGDIALNKATPDRQRLFVSVSRGFSPLLNAQVMATIERPGNAAPVDLDVFDSGAGADVNKDDGIYSNYFTQFVGNGRYNLKVNVQNKDGTVLSPGRVIGVGAGDPNDLAGGSFAAGDIKADDFQRVASAGSFGLSGFSAQKKYYPPATITDLSVNGISHGDYQINLKWTATGSQLYEGTASMYQLRMSNDFNSILQNFSRSSLVTQDMIVNGGNLSNPKPSGVLEEFVVRVPSRGNVAYYFAVAAEDNIATTSERSNIVSASMREAPRRGLSAGAVVGIVLGVLIAIALIVILVIAVMKKRQGTLPPMPWKKTTSAPAVNNGNQKTSQDNDAYATYDNVDEVKQNAPYRSTH